MTLATWIRRNAAWRGDKTALISDGRRLSYAEFNERVNRQVNGLYAMGLVKGDRVAVVVNNTAEAVEAVGAAAKGGFVHVPVSFRLAPREIAQLLKHSGTRVVFVDREHADRLADVETGDGVERILTLCPNDPESEYETWLAAQSPDEPKIDVDPDDDFLIIYTSGTTGAPKGVHMRQGQSIAHAPVPTHYYDIDTDSRLLMVYPHNSIASVNMFYAPAWMLGATVMLFDPRNFSGERWLAAVEAERITHCHMVPTMVFRVMDCGLADSHDLSSLVSIGYGSAPMPPERVRQAFDVFGDILVQGYGMTEISSIAAILSKQDHRDALATRPERLAACGRPVFGCELRLVDEAGQDVGAGQVGEIAMRGPQLMCGYWDDAERTREALPDGWLRSGDMAWADEDGFLYIVDRKKDLIISGAYNIASKEVEEVIGWRDDVVEAAVVGRPDPQWSERVHAFVVLRDGVGPSEADIIAFCRERLAHYKCPDRVEFVASLPRNGLGKLVKAELRSILKERTRETAE